MSAAITVDSPLNLQPYDWHEGDIAGVFTIRMWAHTPNSERVCLVITDFQPFVLYALPEDIQWDARNKNEIIKQLAKVGTKTCPQGYVVPDIRFAMKKKLYFNGDREVPFMKCSFRNMEDLRFFTKLVRSFSYVKMYGKDIVLEPVEADVPMYQRYISMYNLSYAGWVTVSSYQTTDMVPEFGRFTHFGVNEIWASHLNVVAAPEIVMQTHPIIAAVDIETYDPKGGFPNKVMQTHCMFMISLVFQRYRDENAPKTNYIIGLAECLPSDDFQYIKCENEYELIETTFKLIIHHKAVVVTGYNIFGYDFDYMDARLGVKNYPRYFAGEEFNLVRGNILRFREYPIDGPFGTVNLQVPTLEGVVHIDMLHVIKMEYHLENYKLDFVSAHFLNDRKVPISVQEMFDAYTAYLAEKNNPEGVSLQTLQRIHHVADYNVKDSDLCIRLMSKLNQWTAMIEQSSIFNVRMEEIHLRGQQIRVRNKVHNMCTKDGIVLDRVKLSAEEFTGAAVFDPKLGLYENVLILDFSSLYPSIIIAYNICYSTFVPDEYLDLVPDENCNIVEWQENDLSYRVRFLKPEIRVGILPRLCDYYINERANVRASIGPDNPQYLNDILQQRQLALKYANNSLYGVLGTTKGTLILPAGAAAVTAIGRMSNAKAAAFVRDNYGADVIYGDTDSIMITLPNMHNPQEIQKKGYEIAEAISATFTSPLKMEFDEMLSVGFFVSKKRYIGIKTWTNKCGSAEYYKEMPNYHVYRTTPSDGSEQKLYAVMKPCETYSNSGILLDDNLHFSRSQFMVKGLLTARRDNTKWQRDVYNDMMHMLLHRVPQEEIYGYVDQTIMDLLQVRIPRSDLIFKAKMKDHSTGMINKFADRLRKRGVTFNSDDVFEYVLHRMPANTGAFTKGDRIEIPEYVVDNMGIDYAAYAETLITAIDSVLGIAYGISAEEQAKLDEQNVNRATKMLFRQDKILSKISRTKAGTTMQYRMRNYGIFPTSSYWALWCRRINCFSAVMNQIHTITPYSASSAMKPARIRAMASLKKRLIF